MVIYCRMKQEQIRDAGRTERNIDMYDTGIMIYIHTSCRPSSLDVVDTQAKRKGAEVRPLKTLSHQLWSIEHGVSSLGAQEPFLRVFGLGSRYWATQILPMAGRLLRSPKMPCPGSRHPAHSHPYSQASVGGLHQLVSLAQTAPP